MNDKAKAEPAKSEDISWNELRPQLVKLAIELGPLVVFYLGFSFGGRIAEAVPLFAANGFTDPLYPATLLFMVAMLVSLALSALLLHKAAAPPPPTPKPPRPVPPGSVAAPRGAARAGRQRGGPRGAWQAPAG